MTQASPILAVLLQHADAVRTQCTGTAVDEDEAHQYRVGRWQRSGATDGFQPLSALLDDYDMHYHREPICETCYFGAHDADYRQGGSIMRCASASCRTQQLRRKLSVERAPPMAGASFVDFSVLQITHDQATFAGLQLYTRLHVDGHMRLGVCE